MFRVLDGWPLRTSCGLYNVDQVACLDCNGWHKRGA
jgi:hypothetical protein